MGNLDNIAILGIAVKHQLIAEADALEIGNAYRMFRAQQHRLRLDGAEKIRVSIHDHPDFSKAKACVTKLWEAVSGAPLQLV